MTKLPQFTTLSLHKTSRVHSQLEHDLVFPCGDLLMVLCLILYGELTAIVYRENYNSKTKAVTK